MFSSSLNRLVVLIAFPITLASAGNNGQPATSNNRIFWIIPNYRTIDETAVVPPLTPRGKFALFWNDTTDWGAFVEAGALAGIGQASNSNSSFGQGMEGYAKRYATTYADIFIGNLMTDGVFPTLLHQDPRYFRRGKGSVPSRLGYAVSRLVITRTDSRKRQFNYSEIVGNCTAVAISNAYYPDSRTVSDNVQRLGVQLGLDAAGNILKEFWPDLKRKLPAWMAR